VDTLSARPPVKVVRADLIPVEKTVTGPDGQTYALTGCGYAPVDRSKVAADYRGAWGRSAAEDIMRDIAACFPKKAKRKARRKPAKRRKR